MSDSAVTFDVHHDVGQLDHQVFVCSWLLLWWWLWLIIIDVDHFCWVDEWLLNAKACVVMEGDVLLLR